MGKNNSFPPVQEFYYENIFFILALLLTSIVSFASEGPIRVVADGEAYMSEIDTPMQVIARARTNAQNNAIEQAVGVFIRSHTLVSNSQVADDLVYASVRGKAR